MTFLTFLRPAAAALRFALRAAVRAPVTVAVALYFLSEDAVLRAMRPVFRLFSQWQVMQRAYAFLQRQNPYVCLLLFGIPFLVLEPPKLYALFLIGTGHVRSGALLLSGLQLGTIISVERLLHAMLPALLRIGWFAVAYGLVVRVRTWAIGRLAAWGVWQAVAAWSRKVKDAARKAARAALAAFRQLLQKQNRPQP